MAHEFRTERRIEFADTDMAGIVHFSNFFRFMEAAEHAFFRSLGVSLHTSENGVMRGFARVHAACDYRRPLAYEDVVQIRLLVTGKQSSSFSYVFDFRLAGDQEPRASGRMKVVCVAQGPDDEELAAASIPSEIADLIDVAPDALRQADR